MKCDSPQMTLPAHLICFLNMPRNSTPILSAANKAKNRVKENLLFPHVLPTLIGYILQSHRWC